MSRLIIPVFLLFAFSPLWAQENPDRGFTEAKPAASEKTSAKTDVAADEKPVPTGVTRLELEKQELDRQVHHGMKGKAYKKMLPSGFKDVLEAEQRDKVYRIQEDYHHMIHRLHKRIESLEQERDRAFEAILTPEQSEKVKKFRETPASLRPASAKKTIVPKRATPVPKTSDVTEE